MLLGKLNNRNWDHLISDQIATLWSSTIIQLPLHATNVFSCKLYTALLSVNIQPCLVLLKCALNHQFARIQPALELTRRKHLLFLFIRVAQGLIGYSLQIPEKYYMKKSQFIIIYMGLNMLVHHSIIPGAEEGWALFLDSWDHMTTLDLETRIWNMTLQKYRRYMTVT